MKTWTQKAFDHFGPDGIKVLLSILKVWDHMGDKTKLAIAEDVVSRVKAWVAEDKE